MKRSGPLKRTTPLKRGPAPERKTRLAPMSDKRKKVSAARRRFVSEVLTERPACEAGQSIRSYYWEHQCYGPVSYTHLRAHET